MRSARGEQCRADAEVSRDYEAFESFMGYNEEHEEAGHVTSRLIEAGHFEEAERGARECIDYFPESPLGYTLMATLCEAQGQKSQAAQWLRQIIQFMHDRPKQFTSQDEASLQQRINELELPAAP